MRVYGNTIPLTVELLPFATPGKVDVRLRENISQIDSNMYVYDEYSIITYDNGTLEQEINDNLSAWFVIIRSLELINGTSAIYNYDILVKIRQQYEFDEANYAQELGALIEEIYNEDLEVIG